MANSANDVFNDTHKLDSEELRSYTFISKKNLEAFSQSTEALCDKITIKGDPWKHLSALSEQRAAYDVEHSNNVMQTFSMETKRNMLEAHSSVLKERVAELKQELEKMIAASSEASLEVESFHNKQKSKHESYIQALRFYKSHLNLYLNIEDVQEDTTRIKICFFTTKPNDEFSVTLVENKQNETTQWELSGSNPKLPSRQYEALCNRLRETNDISAFTVTVHKIFLRMKDKKN